jgi:hypothetical protein
MSCLHQAQDRLEATSLKGDTQRLALSRSEISQES